jgi:hypothetical protein
MMPNLLRYRWGSDSGTWSRRALEQTLFALELSGFLAERFPVQKSCVFCFFNLFMVQYLFWMLTVSAPDCLCIQGTTCALRTCFGCARGGQQAGRCLQLCWEDAVTPWCATQLPFLPCSPELLFSCKVRLFVSFLFVVRCSHCSFLRWLEIQALPGMDGVAMHGFLTAVKFGMLERPAEIDFRRTDFN